MKSYLFGYLEAIDSSVFSFDIAASGDVDPGVCDHVRQLGGRIFQIPKVSKPIAFVRELIDILNSDSYQIVHGLLNLFNPLAMFPAWCCHVPVRIAESLSTGHPLEGNSKRDSLLRPFARMFSTTIAANSVLAARWTYGSHAESCYILANPVDLEYYSPDEADRRETRRLLGIEDRYVLGWIGRFAVQKNPLFLLDILAAAHNIDPTVVLLVIGYGPLEKSFVERASELGISDYVINVGRTESILPYYRAMDCFVLPSLYEGLPVVGIEAQACGIPCLFSSEITRETGVAEATAFLDLCDSPEIWAQHALAMRDKRRLSQDSELIKHGFSKKDAAKNLEAVYVSLLK